MRDLLREYGIDVVFFIAGMAGGISSLSKDDSKSYWLKFTTVLSGGLVANYLTPLFMEYFNINNNVTLGIGFMIGYSGLKTVEIMINKFKSKVN